MTAAVFTRIRDGVLRVLPYAMLALLPGVYYWRALTDVPFLFFGGEVAKEYFPSLLQSLRSVLDGRYLGFVAGLKPAGLWFNLTHGGFYPANVLLLPFAGHVDALYRAMFQLFLLHHAGAGLAAFMLGRRAFGLRREGAFLVAVLYAFALMRVGIPLHWPVVHALAWLPLFLLCLHRGLTGGRFLPLVWAWLCLLVMFLTGSVASVLLALVLACLTAVWAAAGGRALVTLAKGAAVVLAGLAIPALFLFISLGGAAAEPSSLDFPGFAAKAGFLRFSWLAYMGAPFLVRDIPGWWDQTIYIGIMPLLLCPLALLLPARKYAFPLLLTIACLALAYGPHAPLLHLAHVLPAPRGVPTEHIYWSGVFRLPVGLGLSLLAGMGLDVFMNIQPPDRRRRFARYGRCLAGIFVLLTAVVGMAAVRFALLSAAEGRWGMASALNCAVWAGIQTALFLMAYQRRVLAGSRGLAFLILLMVVVDIFSFWSFFHPANFGFGPSYDMLAPSTILGPGG